jgi:hypothetical protein
MGWHDGPLWIRWWIFGLHRRQDLADWMSTYWLLDKDGGPCSCGKSGSLPTRLQSRTRSAAGSWCLREQTARNKTAVPWRHIEVHLHAPWISPLAARNPDVADADAQRHTTCRWTSSYRLWNTNWPAASMKQTPSWKATSFTASQEISRILRKPKIHCRHHMSLFNPDSFHAPPWSNCPPWNTKTSSVPAEPPFGRFILWAKSAMKKTSVRVHGRP